MFENSTLITRIPQRTGKVLTGTDKGTSLRNQISERDAKWSTTQKVQEYMVYEGGNQSNKYSLRLANLLFGCATKLKKEKDKTNKIKKK